MRVTHASTLSTLLTVRSSGNTNSLDLNILGTSEYREIGITTRWNDSTVRSETERRL